jgi:DNA (cytosine-5)-methyltransferase 1
MSEGYRVLDLFCGAGGLSLGFLGEGFSVTGVDISEKAEKSYTFNLNSGFIRADLLTVNITGEYDVIVGGPPCRPWSPVNTTKRGKAHHDHVLLSKYFEHVTRLRPRMFLMENVPALGGDTFFREYISRMEMVGYSVEVGVVRYSDYGAPTSRRRLIAFGALGLDASSFFEELGKYRRPLVTVRDAIAHLRGQPYGVEPDHEWPILRTIEKYKGLYETGRYGWYILEWDRPAPSFGNVMRTYILHPDSKEYARVISVREALHIMGFPEEYKFPQVGLTARYQMVVDAVSPIFSRVAARVVCRLGYL